MDNNQTAQKALEQRDSKNFFFEHVKKQIANRKDNIVKDLKAIYSRIPGELSKDEFELIGMFSFLVGVDYTSQAYPQKKILENVSARFNELNIDSEELILFYEIMGKINELNKKESIFNVLFKSAAESLKNQYISVIKVPTDKTIDLKLIKSNINKFLDIIQIPIGYAHSIVEFKKSDLTYESLLKANDILNNQGTYTGNYIKRFTELYGNQFFMELLNKASKYFNDTKFAFIYEESIISVLETINRFPLCIDPLNYTDVMYETFKEEHETKEKERLEQIKSADSKEEYQSPQFTGEQVKKLMNEAPDEFVVLNLLDNIKLKEFETPEQVVSAIEAIIKQSDFVEHMFTYVKKNQTSPFRCVGASGIAKVDVKEIVETINKVIEIDSEEYKRLAEANCAEIPSEQLEKIITYVNDVIKGCILKTAEQKQYLISQLMENGITTWNHLQQIMTVIETCDIYGESASSYDNLYNYTQEKTNIQEIFESARKLNDYQIRLSVFHAFKNWFNFHVVVPETESK